MIIGNGPNDEDVLRFQVKRNITILSKRHLEVLEDIIVEHDDALNRLAKNLPEEYKKYLDLADYMTDAKVEQIRKRVLDRGGEAFRAIEDVLKGFDIKLK